MSNNSEIIAALRDLERTRGIPVDYMTDRITQALLAAYKKDKVGYEIPFTRLFYKFVPPVPSEDIFAEIKELEAEETILMNELFHKENE